MADGFPRIDRLVDAQLPGHAIAVGVTGHRLERLDAKDIAGIGVSANAVLRAIWAAAGSPDSAQSCRLVTGLADGADSIVADAAIQRGWTLDAVLAFPRDDFATDFAEGEPRAAHERRLAKAHNIFELPGERSAIQGAGIAYERVGRTVLAQCDILIAVWDNQPARGRGGAAQIAAEAVLQGIPVIQIDPAGVHEPLLLWDGLEEHDLGEQTVETVARGGLDRLPMLIGSLIDPPENAEEMAMFRRFEAEKPRRLRLAIAYPLLLAVMGARRLQRGDFFAPASGAGMAGGSTPDTILNERFCRADAAASHAAQLFRSGYVTNFSFAALAVVLSLMGLALPVTFKPVLIVLELSTIGVILILTRAGNRARWHRRWLDNRQLAERLRCLAVSARLGELDLRAGADNGQGWVGWYARRTAHMIGMPSVRIDTPYLDRVRSDLIDLIDGQVAYLSVEARRMHALEHRLHRLGTLLFAMTAAICVAFLAFEGMVHMAEGEALERLAHPLVVGATILSAALPAIGAAIYGIRMQGDFAGTAERSATLGHHLAMLRKVIDTDDDSFDTLKRRVRRATDLLTEDLTNWLATYHARPLTLPG